MRDIEKAMSVESYYIKDNLGTQVSLLSLLNNYGYNTLTEYFDDKFNYKLHKQNIKINHYLVDEVKDKIYFAIGDGTPDMFAIDEACTWAWVGSDDFDYDKAEKLNVKPCPLGYRGGTIITDNNDFNIALNLDKSIDASDTKFLNKFNNYLNSQGFNTYIDKNDIMLDNKKIAGCSYFTTDKSQIFFMSLALSDHTDLIKELCEKDPAKIPGYLIGITKQQIEQEVNSWLQPM